MSRTLFVTYTVTVTVPLTPEEASAFEKCRDATNAAIDAEGGDFDTEAVNRMVDGFDELVKVLAKGKVPGHAEITNTDLEPYEG